MAVVGMMAVIVAVGLVVIAAVGMVVVIAAAGIVVVVGTVVGLVVDIVMAGTAAATDLYWSLSGSNILVFPLAGRVVAVRLSDPQDNDNNRNLLSAGFLIGRKGVWIRVL
jgi:hypothetical protein